MSQLVAPRIECAHCKEKFFRPRPTGRPPQYCGKECRAAAYRARQASVLRYSQRHDADVVRLAQSVSGRAGAALHRARLPAPSRPLELVEEVVRLQRDLEELKAVAVRQAAEYGAGWSDIAAVLAMSPSHARVKFSDENVAKTLEWRAARGSAPGPRPPRVPSRRPASPSAAPQEGQGPSSPALPGHPGYQLTTALSHLQRSSGHTQRWLAAEVGVSPSLLSRILLGRRNPKWEVVKAVAALCGADPDDLRPLWEKALGIPPVQLPGPEDFLQAAAALKASLRGMWIAAGAPLPHALCSNHPLLAPGRVRRALVTGRPEEELADWPFVAALATALRGQPEDLHPLWQRMQVASALLTPAGPQAHDGAGAAPAPVPHPRAGSPSHTTAPGHSSTGPHGSSPRDGFTPRARPSTRPGGARSTGADAVRRRLEILEVLRACDAPVGLTTLARSCGLPVPQAAEVLSWLREHHFTQGKDGGHTAGPVLQAVAEGRDVTQDYLESLSRQLLGAIYIGTYIDGEIHVSHEAAEPGIPTVHQWVDFRESAHASAVGKATLAQLDREARLDHLSRHQPEPLTPHTITNPDSLFRSLDLTPVQYDLTEYSDQTICAANPLTLPGQTTCIAVALPATERRRLNQATTPLKAPSTTMALSLMLALNTPHPRQPR
ncbi:IclR family transcriptional regulator [Streptomyces sp. 3211.6]|uniref:helix-turn-helix domain-containing protein n=1 Tax=Streptomyces sp. 3211.6 TaxID=1938845 RepID=UPI000C2C0A30|nr:helix-turn-helix domain-containing protein [Streptomyces sp. 3211.6]RKT02154.1 IclR family transcriptional regulator [Streptomyces sp. 3211.6]